MQDGVSPNVEPRRKSSVRIQLPSMSNRNSSSGEGIASTTVHPSSPPPPSSPVMGSELPRRHVDDDDDDVVLQGQPGSPSSSSHHKSNSSSQQAEKRRNTVMDRLANLIEENKLLGLIAQGDNDEIRNLKAALEQSEGQRQQLLAQNHQYEAAVKQLQDTIFHLEHAKFVAEVQSKTIDQQDKTIQELIDENKLLIQQSEIDAGNLRTLQTQFQEAVFERDRLITRMGKSIQHRDEAVAEAKMMTEHSDGMRKSNIELAAKIAELEERVQKYESEDYADFFTRMSRKELQAAQSRSGQGTEATEAVEKSVESTLLLLKRFQTPPEENRRSTSPPVRMNSSSLLNPPLKHTRSVLEARAAAAAAASSAAAFQIQEGSSSSTHNSVSPNRGGQIPQKISQQQSDAPGAPSSATQFSSAGLYNQFGMSPKKSTTVAKAPPPTSTPSSVQNSPTKHNESRREDEGDVSPDMFSSRITKKPNALHQLAGDTPPNGANTMLPVRDALSGSIVSDGALGGGIDGADGTGVLSPTRYSDSDDDESPNRTLTLSMTNDSRRRLLVQKEQEEDRASEADEGTGHAHTLPGPSFKTVRQLRQQRLGGGDLGITGPGGSFDFDYATGKKQQQGKATSAQGGSSLQYSLPSELTSVKQTKKVVVAPLDQGALIAKHIISSSSKPSFAEAVLPHASSPVNNSERPSTSPLVVEAIYGERGSGEDKMYLVKFVSVESEQWTSAAFVDPGCEALARWRRAMAKDRLASHLAKGQNPAVAR